MELKEVQIDSLKKKHLITGNSKYRSSYDFELTEEDLEKAHQKLNESEDGKKESLENLKRKLIENEDMFYRTDDNYLLRYLRITKFNYERAYSIISKFYSLRNKYPELFSLPSDLQELMGKNFITCLPYTDEEGCLIIWNNFRKWNVNEMSYSDILLTYNIISDILTMNPCVQINGLIGIWDFSGFTARHVSQFMQPRILWMTSKLLQDSYPWRVKLIILIHCNTFIKTMFNAVRYLLKKKISERIIFLGSDMSELHQYVNPALLPEECGGSLHEADLIMNDIIVENMPYLEYERSFGPRS